MGSSRSRRRARAPLAVHLTSKGAEMLVKAEAYYDGKFWCARGIGADFFTQGRTLDELLRNAKEAAGLHFAGSRPPRPNW